MEFSEQTMLERYKELCAKRDAVYEQNAPLEKELEKWNQKAEEARVKAAEIASKIDENFGLGWISMKKEIALLARTLSRPQGPLAKKD